MQNSKIFNTLVLFAIIIIPVVISFYYTLTPPNEGFDTVPLATDPKTNNILNGYYQVNENKMALVPYGFAIDPKNPKNILPITKVGISMLKLNYNGPVPKPGEKMPDGLYFATDSSLAVLPPNMLPKIRNIDFTSPPVKILYNYDVGYMSETEYYESVFQPNNYPTTLPAEVYYTDSNKKKVAFLQYGQTQDKDKGFGYKSNEKNPNYEKIKDNYNMQFHDDVETIKKQNDMYDLNFGEVRVKDQNGNIIILPKTESQNSVTFYQPGEFPFGASTYVPNYEDSVYLKSVGYRTFLGNTNTSNCGAICDAYNEFKLKMDIKCGK